MPVQVVKTKPEDNDTKSKSTITWSKLSLIGQRGFVFFGGVKPSAGPTPPLLSMRNGEFIIKNEDIKKPILVFSKKN